jgi:RND family efflux transporter MFP subunit
MKIILWTLLLLATCGAHAIAAGVEGFTEPYRTVSVGVTEVGVVDQMHVREGERVTRGQPLLALDQDVYEALVAIAEANMETRGRLDSANAERDLYRDKLVKLQQLGAQGHARQEEIERARANVAIAEANVRTVEEDLLIRRLEYDKMLAQLQRRTVRAPVDGVVVAVHKQVGEAVAPNDPELITLVQLNALRATFSVPTADAGRFREGSAVQLQFGDGDDPTEGTVEFVSPTIEAESGTVRVKVRIDNSAGKFRAGQRCHLAIPAP